MGKACAAAIPKPRTVTKIENIAASSSEELKWVQEAELFSLGWLPLYRFMSRNIFQADQSSAETISRVNVPEFNARDGCRNESDSRLLNHSAGVWHKAHQRSAGFQVTYLLVLVNTCSMCQNKSYDHSSAW